jgi:hypothetical protein
MVEAAAKRPLSLRARAASLASSPPAALVLAGCVAVLCLRRVGAVTNPQFWAEDAYFFQRAYVLGWNAFAEPFAGYFHTILRSVAALAVSIDPSRAPAIFAACSVLVTACVCSLALSPRCPLPRLGGACALAVVLVPDTYEVLMNDVNLQWVTGAGLVLILISSDAQGPWQWARDLGAAAAIGLTGPFSLVLFPVFAIRAALRRSPASAVLAAVVGICALIQGLTLMTQPPASGGAPGLHVPLSMVLPAIGRRIGGSLLLGAFLSPSTDLYMGTAAGIATLAGLVFLAARPGRIREARILLGLAFLAVLAGVLFRTRFYLDLYFVPRVQERYVYIPQLILIWLLLATAGWGGRAARVCRLLCFWALAVNLPRLREPAYANLHWDKYEAAIREGKRVVVPTNPPGWYMPLPARPKK